MLDGQKLKSMLCKEWRSIISNIDEVPFDAIAEELNSCSRLCPKIEDIFNAFNNCLPKDVKVVIVGQDPYHTKGVAHGYSFSVDAKAKIPPSLRNIHNELKDEYSISEDAKNGSLLPWVKEGVLLMNTILTVIEGSPGSHADIGWEVLTSKIIKAIDENCNCVFLLWGSFATKLCDGVVKNNVVVSCGHPSPMNSSKNNPFLGSKCFRKVNQELVHKGRLPVRWHKDIF